MSAAINHKITLLKQVLLQSKARLIYCKLLIHLCNSLKLFLMVCMKNICFFWLSFEYLKTKSIFSSLLLSLTKGEQPIGRKVPSKAWEQSPSPPQYPKESRRDHHNRGVPTQKTVCATHMKGKGGLKVQLYIWCGWRAVSWGPNLEINEKSITLTCQRREKDLLVCKEVLKTAVKVAEGVEHSTLNSTTHFHTTTRIQMLWKS